MAIIIETCPRCGHDLTDLVITTYPPIPQKKCFGCGWEWTGEQEEVIRVPFGGNSFKYDDTAYTLHGNTDYECVNGLSSLSTSFSTFGDNAININELTDNLMKAFKELEDKFKQESLETFEQSACVNCSNNPKNGGSGICFCTLGQQAIY